MGIRILICLILLISSSIKAESLSLGDMKSVKAEFTLVYGTELNKLLKSPLIFHNSLKGETHFVFVLNKTQKHLDGFKVFATGESSKLVLYSEGHTETSQRMILDKLSLVQKTSFNISILSKAHANDTCPMDITGLPETGSAQAIGAHANESSFTDGVLGCLSGLLEGVWSATGGLLIDGGEFLWDLVTSPIDTAKKTYAQFQNMVDAVANMGETLSNFGSFFSSLDGEAKAHLICSFLGAIGTDVLIAVLTLGGGTPKLVHSLTTYLSRFSKLTRTLRLAKLAGKFKQFFPKQFLNKLAKGKIADKVLDRIDLFSKHDMPRLTQQAVRCAI